MSVLIIGLGSIATKHIVAIQELYPGEEILALRSDRTAKTVSGVKNVFSLAEVGAKPTFILISNPTSLHYKTIEDVIDLGAPLMIEKPAFHRLDGVPALISKLNSRNIFTYVACNLRFHPVIKFLKEHAEGAGRINEVNIYCGSYLPEWRPGKDFRKIYSANADMGGGVHLDLIHEIDYCYWLFGNPLRTNTIQSNHSSLSINAVDYAHYCLQYSSFTAAITLNYFRRDAKREIEIVFDNATWRADLIRSKIVNEKNEVIFEADFHILQSYKLQLQYFMEAISKNATPMNTIAEAYDVLRICLNENQKI